MPLFTCNFLTTFDYEIMVLMSEPDSEIRFTYNLLALDSKEEEFLGEFYVRREVTEIRELITALKITDKPTRILFAGHRGSGKTSELRYLKSKLEQENFLIVFVTTIKDLNLTDVHYTEILLTVIDHLLDLLYLEKVKLDKPIVSKVEELLVQLDGTLTIEEIDHDSRGYGFTAFFKLIGSHIRKDFDTRKTLRSNVKTIISDILELTNTLIQTAEEQTNKHLLIIIDDLEKITSRQQINDIFEGFSLIINNLDCHFLLTLPVSVIHSNDSREKRIEYCRTVMLPLYSVKTIGKQENELEIKEIASVAKKRIVGNCIPDEIIKNAALYSGGLVNDFLLLLANSCLKAITNNKTKVSQDMLDESFAEISNEYKISVEDKHIDLLKEINVSKTLNLNDDAKQLLFSLAVLEYIERDSRKVWYDVHPAVVKAFESNWKND